MGRKSVTFGSVQHEFINSLRAELLDQGGGSKMDLNFTDGANLSVVIAMAFLHAEEYRDRLDEEFREMPIDEAAADIAAEWVKTGDVPKLVKGNFKSYTESFVYQMVSCILSDTPGTLTEEEIESASVSEDRMYEMFTAESPSDDSIVASKTETDQ